MDREAFGRHRLLISDGEMPIFLAEASIANTVKAKRSNADEDTALILLYSCASIAYHFTFDCKYILFR